ncbi:uncharacterized protein At3g27210-like [Olea europaea var. sylvestris]|uniref:uncharacterized protein At3g27210-like n=1 Tax=Olea europaea var. sylvestris TaxID=158386 RepID=UPI000C1D8AFA|nr:uncharacterized protein At3g27210-like [Olea europaea var. sylvestris]
MGGCISVDKRPESAMKLQLSVGSKSEKLLILSPVKEKPETVAGGRRTIADVAFRSQMSPVAVPDSGSKEETFFDSHTWFESDCEDFYSVNGDFTPSRGSTPVHHNFSAGTPRVGRAESTTPPERRKKLSELFRESLQGDQDIDKQNAASNEKEVAEKVEPSPKSAKWTIYISRANSCYSRERTTGRVLGAEDKSVNSVQCCLPRLLSSSRSSTERKRTSPVHNVV